MNRSLQGFVCVIAALAVTLLTTSLQAHPESISSVQMQLTRQGATVGLTLQIRDLTAWFPPGNHPDYLAYVIGGLQHEADGLFEFQADGATISPSAISVHPDKAGCVRVDLSLAFPATTQLVVIRSKHLARLPAGHQQLLCVEDVRSIPKSADDTHVVLEQTINADQDFAEIDMPDPPAAATTKPSP